MAPYAADVFSRKIVAWQIFAEESSEHASNIMQDLCWREHIRSNQVTLHSDNGSPMKGPVTRQKCLCVAECVSTAQHVQSSQIGRLDNPTHSMYKHVYTMCEVGQ